MKNILIILLLLGLTACKRSAEQEKLYSQSNSPDQIAAHTNDRFKVNRVSVFYDELAYHDKRGIYIITDSMTGREYLGISGIGINELGSHSSGKTTTSDER